MLSLSKYEGCATPGMTRTFGKAFFFFAPKVI